MILVLTADLHGYYTDIDPASVPHGDVFILAGDFAFTHDERDAPRLNAWLEQLPHPHKILVAGNHDYCMLDQAARDQIPAATILEDSQITIEGVTFYGSPWHPKIAHFPYGLDRNSDELAAKWDIIPADTNVLITHGPPHGIGDRTVRLQHVGCELLRRRVEVVRPALHVFGHIHEGRGMYEREGTTFINASAVNADYSLHVDPFIVIDLAECGGQQA